MNLNKLLRSNLALNDNLGKVLGESYIVPLIPEKTNNQVVADVSNFLQSNDILVLPIRYPTVAKGTERLRFSLTANMPQDCVTALIEALKLFHQR